MRLIGWRCVLGAGLSMLLGVLVKRIVIGVLCVLVLAVLLPACAGGPRIISSFGDLRGAEGYPRVDGPHVGIDIAGLVGDPVLAAADGTIVFAGETQEYCGIKIVMFHAQGYQTTYCHLDSFVKDLNHVKRGAVIGSIGTTGLKPGRGFEHVHFSLFQGQHIDPMPMITGCFDPKKIYPVDQFYPDIPGSVQRLRSKRDTLAD